MTDEFFDQPPDGGASQSETQQLTWGLLDEQISDDEFARLESLLVSSNTAREEYIRCVQLHADLLHHFAAPPKPPQPATPAKSPVLGFLNAGQPPFSVQPPQTK
jgi:hypothetical protein